MHLQPGNLGKQTQPAANPARLGWIYHTPTAASDAECKQRQTVNISPVIHLNSIFPPQPSAQLILPHGFYPQSALLVYLPFIYGFLKQSLLLDLMFSVSTWSPCVVGTCWESEIWHDKYRYVFISVDRDFAVFEIWIEILKLPWSQCEDKANVSYTEKWLVYSAV